MQIAKKYFTEGLIQFTILLSLIGVRVDVDSYLNGYYPPLFDVNLGPSSAYTQTPFHSLRDNLDGYSVHPKCPELDYFFATRRLLDEVRTLGSPRFPTQLNTWLVHQVSDSDQPDPGDSSNGNNRIDINLEVGSTASNANDEGKHLQSSSQGEHQTTQNLAEQGPCTSGACQLPEEEDDGSSGGEERVSPSQLPHSSSLEQEDLLDGNTSLSDPAAEPHASAVNQHWSHFLALQIADLDDLDSLVSEPLSDLSDPDITGAISQDVSLRDAVVGGPQAYGRVSQRAEARPVTRQQPAPLLLMESTNSSHLDSSSGMTLDLAGPFTSGYNVSRNGSSHDGMGGCLDEAVFDQINMLGLGGMDAIDSHLLNCLESINPRLLEDLDSDSGLSLESGSQGPTSPGTSVVSSSSSSYCEDDRGATGYSSEVDSINSKGIADYSAVWSLEDLSDGVWHDHSYSSQALYHQPSPTSFPHKGIKEEPLSDDEDQGLDSRESSRDEMRARALRIPFTALQIVNMPVDEFLEVLEAHGFSGEQVTLLRDIRRRGKNKLAAQNCRKRKLDAITGLQEEVARLQAQRNRLLREKQLTAKTMGAVGHQIKQLSRDVLSRLRDDSGRPLHPERYTLQCGANGRVSVQPVRRPTVSTTAGSKTDKRKKDKKQ
ncbi:nuclear factor erythroid 2-related factor 3 [Gadus chalcogrammus]|uniref:nuclear factor erythroid 2-related factor 3 n=1 Tax=Gadus chalcogrammus TaxID=1042646 RepID=UPI0024C4CF93|nr:nuclear factor erythroid 2-related factor 3 [Gadus chalcogrammus]